MKKVSFDFDETLDFEIVQEYAKSLIEQGVDVHIVTSRYEDVTRYPFYTPQINLNHNDLFKIAEELGLDKEHIHFTNFTNKYHFFEANQDFIWHLDNDAEEVFLINKHTKTTGIEFMYEDWDYKCNELLK
jgi:hypothetical protein